MALHRAQFVLLLWFTHCLPKLSKEAVCEKKNGKKRKLSKTFFIYIQGRDFSKAERGVCLVMHLSTIYALENLSLAVLNWSVQIHCQER